MTAVDHGADAVLDLRGVRGRLDLDTMALILTDGDVHVILSCGLPGPAAEAVAGADRLVLAVSLYAEMVRRVARATRDDPVA